MAGLDSKTPIPTRIVVHQKSRVLEIEFEGAGVHRLSFEFLRVFSPSAEVRGHGPGQETLQVGKRDVSIEALEPVGNYAVQPRFSDGHATGIYSWDYLYELASNQRVDVAGLPGAARSGRAGTRPGACRRRVRRRCRPRPPLAGGGFPGGALDAAQAGSLMEPGRTSDDGMADKMDDTKDGDRDAGPGRRCQPVDRGRGRFDAVPARAAPGHPLRLPDGGRDARRPARCAACSTRSRRATT